MNSAQKIINSDFDIAALLAADAAPIEKTFTVSVLFDKDGNHRAGFEIVSKNSEQYQAAIRATTVSAIKRGQTKSLQIDGKTDEGAGTLADLGEKNQMMIAQAVIVGTPGFTNAGQPLTAAEITALLAKFPTWKDKIIAALEADANFLAI